MNQSHFLQAYKSDLTPGVIVILDKGQIVALEKHSKGYWWVILSVDQKYLLSEMDCQRYLDISFEGETK